MLLRMRSDDSTKSSARSLVRSPQATRTDHIKAHLTDARGGDTLQTEQKDLG